MRYQRQNIHLAWGEAAAVLFMVAVVFVTGVWEASAQTEKFPTLRIIILDFEVVGGMDPMLGRKAADALAVEFSNSKDFEVIPRAEIQQAILNTPGLSVPMDRAAQQKLAMSLPDPADAVLSGKVLSYSVGRKPPSARISFSVNQLDTISGEPTNGTVTSAEVHKLETVEPDVLLDEAINKAAYQAVVRMRETILPRGMVMAMDHFGNITLNIGATSGLKVGDHMVVTRDLWNETKQKLQRQRIGEISVVGVEPAHATARVVGAARGIQTSDRVTAIYELPSEEVSPVAGRPRRPVSGYGATNIFSKVLVPVVLLAALTGTAGGSDANVAAPGAASASPSAVGDVSAVGGTFAQASSNGSSVIVKWSIPSEINPSDVLGHVIYRSTTPGFGATCVDVVAVVLGNGKQWSDSADAFNFEATLEPSQGQGGQGGGGASNITYDQYDPDEFPECEGTVPGFATEEMTITARHDPLINGQTYYYSVQRITQQRPTPVPGGGQGGQGGGGGGFGGGGGGFGGGGFGLVVGPSIDLPWRRGGAVRAQVPPRQQQQGQAGEMMLIASQISTASGGATPLDKANLTAPDNNSDSVDLNDVTFEWEAVEGADRYVIQVASRGDFPVSQRFQSDEITSADPAGTTLSQSFANLYVPIPAGQDPSTFRGPYYWRVGARKSTDGYRPGSATGNPNDEGYVFSAYRSFRVFEPPPPPPVSSARRRVLDRLRDRLPKEAQALSPAKLRQLARERARRFHKHREKTTTG